jgi:hypothetical protein
MVRNTLRSVWITAVALILFSGVAVANDQDVRATTVPATACQPRNSVEAERVVLSNGAWVFSGTNTGEVMFYCPLPLNAWTVSNISNDNDISAFRVYYRDTDGAGNAARVTARLVYRLFDGLYSAGNTWSSNVNPVTTNTTWLQDNPHDVRSLALYSFLVTLRRTNTSQEPAFSGIDFVPPPVP